MNFIHKSFVTTTYQIHTEYLGELSDGTWPSIPGTSIIAAISIFETGPISFSASIDAYGWRIEIEADPRHSELLIKNFGLQTGRKE